MLRILGLAAIAALLLASISCTQQTQQNDNTAKLATTTPTPAAPTASPTPSAPMTANVKASNFKWTDEASGTAITTIKVGGTITFTNGGGTHSLEKTAAGNGCEALDDSFTSSLPATKKFDRVGVFGYHCGVHKGVPNCNTPPGDTSPRNMPGVIKVVP